jgi:hypothetical protein
LPVSLIKEVVIKRKLIEMQAKNNTKYKYISMFVILIIAFSCQVSKKQLIIGKWEVHYDSSPHEMIINFRKDNIAVLKTWDKNVLTLTDSFSYKLVNDEKYLDLEPLSTRMQKWNIEILELNNKLLKIRSQSPDSSSLILYRIEELN